MSFALSYCFSILCLLPFVITAQKYENISLGRSLKAGDESSMSSPWVSPSGDFAFGFQEVGTGSYLLAIWFNSIPEKTVTWSANRDALAPRGSMLMLTSAGRLVLIDPSGSELWSGTPGRVIAYAAMLNTGNLVLASVDSSIIWQSFDYPTDTILPTQVMGTEIKLNSRVSDTNYSTGKFLFRMQADANLVFYIKYSQNDSDLTLPAYDAIVTAGQGLQVVFNESGSIYLTLNNGLQDIVLEDDTDSALYYQRAIFEFDGVLRKYVYPRSSSKSLPMKWTMRKLRPEDICSYASGTGLCGPNSICQIGDDQIQRTICKCPPGYSFLDQADQMKGCKPNFIQQSCSDDPLDNGQFQVKEMLQTYFPDSSQYQTLYSTTVVSCGNFCLADCNCAAVFFDGDTKCNKLRSPLSNGWINKSEASNPGKTFIKVRIGNPTIQPMGGGNNKMKYRTVILIESVFLGSSVVLNILLLSLAVFAVTSYPYKRKTKSKTQHDQGIAGINMRNFSYMELQEATGGFKEIVGQGAFATVYKGLLDSEEGNVVAVKKLNEMAKENQREFESEVRAIARTGHRNLVQLIGFCAEGQHRLLVYEYMSNGSLADVLLQGHKPNLLRRIKFALETAIGLNYLHEECSTQIIHCDIKLQNILLDDSFTTRISDFGLAKLLKKDQAHTITGIRGTKGYVAPEWFRSVPVTTKVDVYSFGILLLELICCRRCFQAEMEDESQMVLADWACDCYEEGRVDKLVEGDNEALADIKNIEELVRIALGCIQEDPSLRPSMNKVVQMIKQALNESLPQDPAMTFMIPMSPGYHNSQPSSRKDF